MKRAVIYYRVSAIEQEKAALGLEAQTAAVQAFCSARELVIVAKPFVEADELEGRLELEAAINCCRRTGAVLVVPTLEHLSRNSLFLLTIRDSGVAFVAADMPNADDPSIDIMDLAARQEREVISMRLKAAKAHRKRAGAAVRREKAVRRQRQGLG